VPILSYTLVSCILIKPYLGFPVFFLKSRDTRVQEPAFPRYRVLCKGNGLKKDQYRYRYQENDDIQLHRQTVKLPFEPGFGILVPSACRGYIRPDIIHDKYLVAEIKVLYVSLQST